LSRAVASWLKHVTPTYSDKFFDKPALQKCTSVDFRNLTATGLIGHLPLQKYAYDDDFDAEKWLKRGGLNGQPSPGSA
jgi:hypothetical protein